MSGESFLAVSTGCLNSFSDNTRTKFTNILAKPAKVVKSWGTSLYLDVEQTNFEYTPKYYENNEFDIKHNEVLGKTHFKLPKCYSIEEVLFYFNHPTFTVSIFSENENGVKLMLTPKYELEIHDKLIDLLEIGNQVHREMYRELENIRSKEMLLTDAKFDITRVLQLNKHFTALRAEIAEKPYKILKKGVNYISITPIKLNRSVSNYVDLICDEIQPYFCDDSLKKIISRINVRNKTGYTIHIDTLLQRFYKIEGTKIETLTFELRQSNGGKLYLEEGPPTIIKARLKEMDSRSSFFYMQINSKETQLFPNNSPCSFTVELPHEIEVNGEWEVALTHAELPVTGNLFKHSEKFFTFTHEPCVCHIIEVTNDKYVNAKHVIFFKGETTAYELFHNHIKIMMGATSDLRVDENETVYLFTKRDTKYYIAFSDENFIEFLYPFPEKIGLQRKSFKELKESMEIDVEIAFELTEKHLRENGLASLENRYVYIATPFENSKHIINSEFLFTFDEYYNNETAKKNKNKNKEKSFEEKSFPKTKGKKTQEEENTLLQIHEKNTGVKYVNKSNPTWLFLYADFVKPTLIADCYTNLLKLIPYKKNLFEDGRFYTFTPLDFFSVNKDRMKTLTFELRNHSGEKHNFRTEKPTSLTLMFRER